jgi:hypothetical protein
MDIDDLQYRRNDGAELLDIGLEKGQVLTLRVKPTIQLSLAPTWFITKNASNGTSCVGSPGRVTPYCHQSRVAQRDDC